MSIGHSLSLVSSCILLTLAFTHFSFAQSPSPMTSPAINQISFPASRAISDYSYTYNEYRLADNAYIVAKSEYQTYQTLPSKQKALEATKTMISLRADVIRTYLIALRQTLLETPALDNTARDPIIQTIDSQAKWVEMQKALVPSAGTLDDLVKLSQKLEDKYPEIEITYYSALTNILASRETSLLLRVESLTESVRQTVLSLGSQGTKTDVLERWLLEEQTRIDLAREKHEEAFSLLSRISAQVNTFNTSTTKAALFSQIRNTLQEENIYLKEALSFLSQTIKEADSAGL